MRIRLVALILLIAVGSAYAADLPVQYGKCRTGAFPRMGVGIAGQDTTWYGPGTAPDTLEVTFMQDSLDVWIVMALDDSSSKTPPCDCDTATGGDHPLWAFDRYFYWRNPYPAGEYAAATVVGDTVQNVGCPDTLYAGRFGFNAADADGGAVTPCYIKTQGRLSIGGTNILAPGIQTIKVYVRVDHHNAADTTYTTGSRVLVRYN